MTYRTKILTRVWLVSVYVLIRSVKTSDKYFTSQSKHEYLLWPLSGIVMTQKFIRTRFWYSSSNLHTYHGVSIFHDGIRFAVLFETTLITRSRKSKRFVFIVVVWHIGGLFSFTLSYNFWDFSWCIRISTILSTLMTTQVYSKVRVKL